MNHTSVRRLVVLAAVALAGCIAAPDDGSTAGSESQALKGNSDEADARDHDRRPRPVPAGEAGVSVFELNREASKRKTKLSRPELFLVNNSPFRLCDFSVRYYFRTEDGRTPLLEDWWTPGAETKLTHLSGDTWAVVLSFSHTSLDPGERFPKRGALSWGLRYRDRAAWDLENDFSDTQSRRFVAAPYIPVLAADGRLIGGNDLFPPNRVQSYTAAQRGIPVSAYSTTPEQYAATVPLPGYAATWDDLSKLNADVAAAYIDVDALLARTTDGDASALQPIFDDIPAVNADNFADKLPEIRDHYESARRYELVQRVAEASATGSFSRAGSPAAAAAANYDDLPSLNEFWVLLGCLGCIDGVKQASERARASAAERFPGQALYLDQGDAYRHGVWAALIVNKTADHFGSVNDALSFARKFTDAHEAANPSDVYGDTAMDLHNNAFSLDYIRSVAGTRTFKNFWLIVWFYKTVVTTPSTDVIESTVYQRALEGLTFDNIDQLACLKLAWLGPFGKCSGTYQFVPQAVSWSEARAACAALGQHLVTISSSAENSYVASLAPTELHAWIGLTKTNTGQWQWVDGSSATFTNWASGEPNNADGNEKYVELRPAVAATWNDLPDSWRIPYICEKE